jgi:2-polyprenyl-6-methoxyphenol hydroxylase-like FAD-dependent oxidoreductase
LLGDAAHPFLPTSIQGCSQAIEDGVALATLLSLSHFDKSVESADKIPAALHAYERLRYERVKAAQKKGEEVRDMWHKADWAKVRQNPSSIKLPREDWLLKHDCEKFVRRMWRRVLSESAGGPRIPLASLAANKESDEFDVEMALTPAATPMCEPNDPASA